MSVPPTQAHAPPPGAPAAGDAPSGLLPQHQAQLDASGIAPAVAAARGYTSATTKVALARLGFAPSQQLPPALVVPIHDTTGKVALHQIRPDAPRPDPEKAGKTIKYETPAGKRLVLDVPPAVRPRLGDPKVPLVVTEGCKKIDSAVSRGVCGIALLGVDGWRGKNPDGGKTALPDWADVALNGRLLYLCFDSDVSTKPAVARALRALKAYLEYRGATVKVIYLPGGDGGAG